MSDWNWTSRAKMIGMFLKVTSVIAISWILFVGTFYALGGN